MRVIPVESSLGPSRLVADGPLDAAHVLLLGHGAGGGIEAPDLELLARLLPPAGITVVRHEQPWRTAGKRVAAPPNRLDQAWREAVDVLREELAPESVLAVGGRSAGARVACRTAVELGAAAVLALAFPLHPPGRPEASRAAELLGAGVPALVLQGSKDTFSSAADVARVAADDPAAGQRIRVVEVPGAGHPLTLPKRSAVSTEDFWADQATVVADFLRGADTHRPAAARVE